MAHMNAQGINTNYFMALQTNELLKIDKGLRFDPTKRLKMHIL